MAYTAVRLGQAAIDTSASTIYTTPASTTTIVKSIDICNTNATATTVRVHLVPSGGSIGTGNAFLYDYSMAGNAFLSLTGSQVLGTGATLQVQAGATGLTITASGVEIT